MARWWTARSVKRQGETDHTRVTLLEDDVDTLEGRLHELEEKDTKREKREAVEAAAGGVVRYFGLIFVALASAAVAEFLRVLIK